MSKDNFNQLFKALAILVSSIIGIGLAVLTLSGKVGSNLYQSIRN
jgi:hypothetical protein